MKKVAGKVKLELAQYRELASFAQFGSDVDADTKRRLDHGIVLMEILKQPQYQPIPVENQIMIIYAASNDYLTDLDVSTIKAFEKELYTYMDTYYPEVGKSIVQTGVLGEEAEQMLQKGIKECKEKFIKLNV
jgi:F-type H+-transporting ATPase subunit alpha